MMEITTPTPTTTTKNKQNTRRMATYLTPFTKTTSLSINWCFVLIFDGCACYSWLAVWLWYSLVICLRYRLVHLSTFSQLLSLMTNKSLSWHSASGSLSGNVVCWYFVTEGLTQCLSNVWNIIYINIVIDGQDQLCLLDSDFINICNPYFKSLLP